MFLWTQYWGRRLILIAYRNRIHPLFIYLLQAVILRSHLAARRLYNLTPFEMNLFLRISSHAPAILLWLHDLLLVKIICVFWRQLCILEVLRSRKIKAFGYLAILEIFLLLLLKGVVIVGFVILSRIPEIVLRVPWTIHMCYVSERLPLFVLRTCSTRFIASLWRLYLSLLLFFGQIVSVIFASGHYLALFGIVRGIGTGVRWGLIIIRMRLHLWFEVL